MRRRRAPALAPARPPLRARASARQPFVVSLCERVLAPPPRTLLPRRPHPSIRAQLVLVRGDFSGHLRKADAAHLLTLMRYYYFSEPGAVETFNLDPRAFDWTRHLAGCPNPPHLASSG